MTAAVGPEGGPVGQSHPHCRSVRETGNQGCDWFHLLLARWTGVPRSVGKRWNLRGIVARCATGRGVGLGSNPLIFWRVRRNTLRRGSGNAASPCAAFPPPPLRPTTPPPPT